MPSRSASIRPRRSAGEPMFGIDTRVPGMLYAAVVDEPLHWRQGQEPTTIPARRTCRASRPWCSTAAALRWSPTPTGKPRRPRTCSRSSGIEGPNAGLNMQKIWAGLREASQKARRGVPRGGNVGRGDAPGREDGDLHLPAAVPVAFADGDAEHHGACDGGQSHHHHPDAVPAVDSARGCRCDGPQAGAGGSADHLPGRWLRPSRGSGLRHRRSGNLQAGWRRSREDGVEPRRRHDARLVSSGRVCTR